MELSFYDHGQIRPDQIRHRLTEDGWSRLEIGDRTFEVPRDDLDKVRGFRELAQAIAAEAAMWARDLEAIEAVLTAPTDPPTDPPDEPFGGDDPELDAAVARVADMPETHRKPSAKSTPKDEK